MYFTYSCLLQNKVCKEKGRDYILVSFIALWWDAFLFRLPFRVFPILHLIPMLFLVTSKGGVDSSYYHSSNVAETTPHETPSGMYVMLSTTYVYVF